MSVHANEWWASLRHGGVLVAPSQIEKILPATPKPLSFRLAERLRRDVTRLEGNESVLLDTVLEAICRLGVDGAGSWTKGSQISTDWTRRSLSGKAIRPRRIWQGPHGSLLPVFVTDEKRVGIGRGRAAVSEVVEWLRAGDEKLALITNARQWRLIYAGLDFSAWCEWDVDRWFEEGEPGPQVDALRVLLAPETHTAPDAKSLAPLLAAISATRKGQSDLSAVLGERVRRAVELLIHAHRGPLSHLGDSVANADIYRAATRVVMRFVVLFFAEARELLPRDNPIYHGSYGLTGLLEQLERVGSGAGAERLRHRWAAWPRLLALFRLVHGGSPHEALPVRRYGGGLFAAGSVDAEAGIDRALAVFEDPHHSPSDADVREMVRLLARTKVKVRAGRGATWVDAPVDFSDLSSEYIGILYEGLLDFELHDVGEGETVVFLALGDQPALPLSRLEAMNDKELANLVEKFKKPTSSGPEPDDELGDEDGAEEDAESTDDDPAAGDGSDHDPSSEQGEEAAEDIRRDARDRAEAWARRAIEIGKLVKKPRSKSADAQRAHEEAVAKTATQIVVRVVLPGEWYLVRWGGTRKGSGTFYTPPGLAVPTVHRTLRPLVYDAPPGDDGKPNIDAPAAEWTPKTPEQILALKMIEPAMGSGTFLVAALRFLTDALYAALHHHDRLVEHENGHTVVTLAEGHAATGQLVEDLTCRRDAEEFESRLRARLKRYIVERCLYGVDLDPLAAELARLALWVETMDRDLPFEFLDHKLKVGNALVGCWFDRFQDYPVMAWEREGGDKGHTNGVHYEKGAWTKAIKAHRKMVAAEMQDWITRQARLDVPVAEKSATEIHEDAVRLFEELHAIPVHESEERARFYAAQIDRSEAICSLREAFDTWCAIWFWPGDRLGNAPMPLDFRALSTESRGVVRSLRDQHHFFHWEIEFPDVFAKEGAGFDAVLGNPPWDTVQPSSMEFFSALDPLYRAYGKQEAVRAQTELFAADSSSERDWIDHLARFKNLANWFKCAASPFGDPDVGRAKFGIARGKANHALHTRWRDGRAKRHGYADPEHPYRHQGSGKPYLQKLFLEQAHALLRDAGRLGFIVPSGLYTDKGTTDLRKLFFERCDWQWLFGFENNQRIFDIDSRFKFGPVIVQKGGTTAAVRTAFMHRDLADWENAEQHVIPYTGAQVQRFSPTTRALFEISSERDLEILERIYADSVLLGDDGPDGWGISYAQGDFNMTSDRRLCVARPALEEQGYRSDAYGRWVRADETVHLPCYQGVMLHQFDFAAKRWISGTGLRAKWDPIPWTSKCSAPQFLMSETVFAARRRAHGEFRVGMRRVARNTDARTVISALLPPAPCGDKVAILTMEDANSHSVLVAMLNSYVLDFVMRTRGGGTQVDRHALFELPLPTTLTPDLRVAIRRLVLQLNAVSMIFAPEWVRLAVAAPSVRARSVQENWALTPHARIRARCAVEALVAALFGVTASDFRQVITECDFPIGHDTSNLDTRGFWRTDRELDPEVRLPILSLAALIDLERCVEEHGNLSDGVVAFLQPGGDGWDLPDTMRLADLGVGHDDGAQEPQPVRDRFGPHLLPMQKDLSVEASWAECERHAQILLGDDGYAALQRDLQRADVDQTYTARAAEDQPRYRLRGDDSQGMLFGRGEEGR